MKTCISSNSAHGRRRRRTLLATLIALPAVIGSFDAWAKAPNSKVMQATAEEAEAAYAARNFKQAALLFHRAFDLSQHPGHLYSAGRAEQQAGLTAEAMASFTVVLKLTPAHDPFHRKAALYLKQLQTAALPQPTPTPSAPPVRSTPPPPVVEVAPAVEAPLPTAVTQASEPPPLPPLNEAPATPAPASPSSLPPPLAVTEPLPKPQALRSTAGAWWLIGGGGALAAGGGALAAVKWIDVLAAKDAAQKGPDSGNFKTVTEQANPWILAGYIAAGAGLVAAGVGVWRQADTGVPQHLAVVASPSRVAVVGRF